MPRSPAASLWSKIGAFFRRGFAEEAEPDLPLELPWQQNWDWVAKRSAGPGFSRRDYREARERGMEVARATLGDDLWRQLLQIGRASCRERV